MRQQCQQIYCLGDIKNTSAPCRGISPIGSQINNHIPTETSHHWKFSLCKMCLKYETSRGKAHYKAQNSPTNRIPKKPWSHGSEAEQALTFRTLYFRQDVQCLCIHFNIFKEDKVKLIKILSSEKSWFGKIFALVFHYLLLGKT